MRGRGFARGDVPTPTEEEGTLLRPSRKRATAAPVTAEKREEGSPPPFLLLSAPPSEPPSLPPLFLYPCTIFLSLVWEEERENPYLSPPPPFLTRDLRFWWSPPPLQRSQSFLLLLLRLPSTPGFKRKGYRRREWAWRGDPKKCCGACADGMGVYTRKGASPVLGRNYESLCFGREGGSGGGVRGGRRLARKKKRAPPIPQRSNHKPAVRII